MEFIRRNFKIVLVKVLAMGCMVSTTPVVSDDFYNARGQRIAIEEDHRLIAEVLTPVTQSDNLVRTADPNATMSENTAGYRIWNTASVGTKASLTKAIGEEGYRKRFLPVYREKNGQYVLVPIGGMVVSFREGVDDNTIKSWAAKKGLHVERRIGSKSRNTYLIQSPPGSQSIIIANQSLEDSIVSDAIPNFWMIGDTAQ